MYMPKSAIPVQPQQLPQSSTTYMPKTAVPVQPEKKSVGGFLGNVGKSAVSNLESIAQAVAHPVQTAKSMIGLGAGAVSKFIPGYQKSEENVDRVANYYKQRYGQDLGKTLYEDPVGVALDVASVATGVGGLAKGAGTLTRVPGLVKAGSTLSKVGTAIDPLSQAGKIASGTTRAISNKIRPIALEESSKMVKAGLGNPQGWLKAEQKYGQTAQEFFNKNPELYTRTPEAGQFVKKRIGETFDTTAMQSGKSVNTGAFIKQINDKISELRQGFGGQVSESDLDKIKKLEEVRDKFTRGIVQQGNLESVGEIGKLKPSKRAINAGISGEGTVKDLVRPEFSPLKTSISDLTTFRRKVIEPDTKVRDFVFGEGKASGAKEARDIVRRTTIKAVPELEQLGMDYGMATNVAKLLENAASRASNRQLFNFSKLGSAGVGAFIGGIPGLVGGFVTEQMVNSPKFLEIASKILASAGKTKQTSPLFGKVGQGAYLFGKAGRMSTADQKQPISPKVETQLPSPVTYPSIIPSPYKVPQIRRTR